MKTILVGFCGLKGSGKDTLADYFVKHTDGVKIALADPIKRYCMDAFGWSEETLWGSSELREVPDPRAAGLTPRKALQLLGTEWGRELYENVWVDKALVASAGVMKGFGYARATGLVPRLTGSGGVAVGRSVFIPDVRFRNEVDAISAAGGKVVRVHRSSCVKNDMHASEQEQLTIPDGIFDSVVWNEGPKEVLELFVLDFLQRRGMLAEGTLP